MIEYYKTPAAYKLIIKHTSEKNKQFIVRQEV